MTAYCIEKVGGTQHTCLCTALAHHIGGHRCACGHTWGDPWHEMTYDQQRELLGLPDVRLLVTMERMRTGLNRMQKQFNTLGESISETWNLLREHVQDQIEQEAS